MTDTGATDVDEGADRAPVVPRGLDVAAAWSWRLIVIAIVLLGTLQLVVRLRVVLLPVVVALLLSNVLVPVRRFFVARRVPGPLAMLATVATFFGGLAALGFVIVPPLVDEAGSLDETIDEAVTEIEDWLVDGPLGLERDTIADGRDRIQEGVRDFFDGSGALADGVVLVGEILAGALLALVITFFIVKDGEEIQEWATEKIPERHRTRVRAAADAAWHAIGGYLRGAAALGVLEGAIMGITLLVVGADLALPVASLTFIAAFIPFVGAIAAGVVGVLVALVTAGPPEAAIVAVVAIVVQQFDNDLLAPFIYGKALSLHPLAVIVSVAAGAALFGLVGAFLAVPFLAVTVRSFEAARTAT